MTFTSIDEDDQPMECARCGMKFRRGDAIEIREYHGMPGPLYELFLVSPCCRNDAIEVDTALEESEEDGDE